MEAVQQLNRCNKWSDKSGSLVLQLTEKVRPQEYEGRLSTLLWATTESHHGWTDRSGEKHVIETTENWLCGTPPPKKRNPRGKRHEEDVKEGGWLRAMGKSRATGEPATRIEKDGLGLEVCKPHEMTSQAGKLGLRMAKWCPEWRHDRLLVDPT